MPNTHNTNEKLSKNRVELINQYNKFGKSNLVAVQYINSFNNELQRYCSLRLIIVNNNVIDFFFRPSTQWNIHTKDQDKNKIIDANKYFEQFYNKNKSKFDKLLNDLYAIYGCGFYAHDFIISNDTLYLCETGLKYHDDGYYKVIKPLNTYQNTYELLKEDDLI